MKTEHFHNHVDKKGIKLFSLKCGFIIVLNC